METKEYFEKVMQDFNQHRNGRSLCKYCQDEGIDYKWLQEYKRTYPNETKPVQESKPEPQSFIPLVIEEEKTQPKSVWQVSTYDDAFIFYSKDLKKVKILHYDINGFVIYAKWFDDGRFLSPYFKEARRCHRISRELLILLLSTSVQTRITINDEDRKEA